MTVELPRTGDSAPLLQVNDLSKVFGGGGLPFRGPRPEVRAVDGVSFSVRRGETLGIVGETGSGKSTLGRLLIRLLDPSGGRIVFGGRDITTLAQSRVRRLRHEMQMVFQDPYGSLDPRMKVGSIVAEPMLVHRTDRSVIAHRTAEILERVGLSPAMAERYPHEFSGGQRQRIGIARAIALDPKLLILDEPVSALDVSIQAQILNLLRDIQRQSGVAYIFIAHDLAVVRHISERIAVMYLGRIVETAPRERLYAAPRHPYTASLLSAVPVPNLRAERQRKRIALYGEIGSATALPHGCRFHPRCFKARQIAAAGGVATTTLAKGVAVPSRCVDSEPPLAEDGNGHFAACHFPLEPGAAGLQDTAPFATGQRRRHS